MNRPLCLWNSRLYRLRQFSVILYGLTLPPTKKLNPYRWLNTIWPRWRQVNDRSTQENEAGNGVVDLSGEDSSERWECFCRPPISKLFTEHHAVRSALWNIWYYLIALSIPNINPSSAACRRRIIFGSQQREAIVSMSSRNRCKIRRSVKVGLKTLHRENISCILPTLCSVIDITNNWK